MPFDGKPTPAQNLDTLITALRLPMPEGFEWDFFFGHTCAIGLTYRLGLADIRTQRVVDALGLTEAQSSAVFGRHAYPVPTNRVTPQMVADRLEEIRATR